MKRIYTYIFKHKRRMTFLFLGISVLISLIIATLLVKYAASDKLQIYQVSGFVFLPMLFFYTVMISSELYGIHTQFGVSRRSGLLVMLSYLLLTAAVVSLISMLIEAELSLIFNQNGERYSFMTFAHMMRILNGAEGSDGILIGYLVNVMVFMLPVTGALLLIVSSMFLSGRVLAAVYGSIYLIFMICTTYGEKLITPIWTALQDAAGISGALVIVMLGFEIIVLVSMSMLYLRTNWKERQIAV